MFACIGILQTTGKSVNQECLLLVFWTIESSFRLFCGIYFNYLHRVNKSNKQHKKSFKDKICSKEWQYSRENGALWLKKALYLIDILVYFLTRQCLRYLMSRGQ